MILRTYINIYVVDKRLLKQFNLIKEQNLTLIKASNNSSHSGTNDNSEGNPLQAALVNSLQHQLHSIRDEVTNLYKHQNTSSQKLLNMNEILREREDNVRALEAENVSLKASVNRLSKAREDDFEGKRERERGIENLQDEIQTLKLELSQIEHRNQMLKNDNAVLIQRWLDRMNDEAEKMNDANEFIMNYPISNQIIIRKLMLLLVLLQIMILKLTMDSSLILIKIPNINNYN